MLARTRGSAARERFDCREALGARRRRQWDLCFRRWSYAGWPIPRVALLGNAEGQEHPSELRKRNPPRIASSAIYGIHFYKTERLTAG
jgi:hypothetical protein